MSSTRVGTKRVYDFSEGSRDMRDLLGGKGANVAEMTRLGLPVPKGFTITTEPFCVAVATYRSGRRLEGAVIEGSGMYRSTAEAAVAAAELLDPEKLPVGCLDPHEVLSLASLRPALSARGIHISEGEGVQALGIVPPG